MSNSQSVSAKDIWGSPEDMEKAFWQLWEQNRDYLYRCCVKWMGGNPTDAEEVLSRAMLKAWDKLPNHAEKITNLRAWLIRLTHNLCIDIHRERRRKAMQMEDIEELAATGNSAVISGLDSPEEALLHHELGHYIRRAIDTLPSRLRNPFILRYCHQIAYQDIAQKLALSLNNVYKRIQQAREILQKRLSRYLSGLDDALLDFSESSQKGEVAPIADEFTVGVAQECLPRQDFGAGGLPLQSDETIAPPAIAPIPQNIGETINYQVTASCLETLHSGWYPSLSPLGWS
ncbi:MAG: RNA polymerase sigma factor [Microcoleus sp. PH2017_01_SCD_O_A]|uniref:RNA polymerase sigma factor n=1 Tax=unclassified Microcoleus TaxID=2642155 RepID=UPI001DEF8BA0|nr:MULTISPECIES: RNA polymerase sigma factor [unclassified Microcoleus]TAE09063.1 MAG: RNA polymerase sigma factor [Oscillatoriales cyanobacterium]MCC3424185.1 RNA polymerase sigma factor [Microcoleus sp. PH2017_01_SCD_O_A]MCC3447213.1 RNA polymerase sigma factor [Microcoleus sp. PH2017_09_SFU_O_A]MCC3535013.1 RNA polymerase sigma factor [Microcoleus sp. PH2017_25_DOB_D_A]MCC3547302.1 RNA polymerase sigma factor [Microcoleus sp. PH2017_24_DOB_U_A]